MVVLDDWQAVASGLAPWEDVPGTVEFEHGRLRGDALVERLADADAVVVVRERTRLGEDVLSRLPRLRLVVTGGLVNAALDLPACARHGVAVAGVPAPSAATAELAWGLLLALLRGIPTEDAAVRAGGWQRTVGLGLQGRTLGLLGLGKLGSRMVPVARAFGMDVLAWSPHLTDERAAVAGVRRVERDELFAASDVVSLHLVLAEATRGIVGAEQLRLLGPQGYLVNTSRSGLVDGDALLTALREGTIAGAGLDVFDEEPLPEGSPWRTAPRTVLTPHLGYVTVEQYRDWFAGAVRALVALAEGREPEHLLRAREAGPHGSTAT